MTEVQLMSAYRERAHLVAHLAAVYPSAIGTDPMTPGWPVVYVETAAGQLSWHISPDDMALFDHVVRSSSVSWDGHTTDEKYGRLGQLTEMVARRTA